MKRNYSERINLTVLCVLALIMMLVFSGCGKEEPTKADFSFEMPEGYNITDLSEKSCEITREKDHQIVGGINKTLLSVKDLKKGNYAGYIDEVSGSELGAEYFSWEGGTRRHPIEYITQIVSYPDTDLKHEYQRIMFEHNKSVYDMWFDTELIDKEEISSKFYPIIEK